jgi:hypothetical protein
MSILASRAGRKVGCQHADDLKLCMLEPWFQQYSCRRGSLLTGPHRALGLSLALA